MIGDKCKREGVEQERVEQHEDEEEDRWNRVRLNLLRDFDEVDGEIDNVNERIGM